VRHLFTLLPQPAREFEVEGIVDVHKMSVDHDGSSPVAEKDVLVVQEHIASRGVAEAVEVVIGGDELSGGLELIGR
jgi:hypothetical protein